MPKSQLSPEETKARQAARDLLRKAYASDTLRITLDRKNVTDAIKDALANIWEGIKGDGRRTISVAEVIVSMIGAQAEPIDDYAFYGLCRKNEVQRQSTADIRRILAKSKDAAMAVEKEVAPDMLFYICKSEDDLKARLEDGFKVVELQKRGPNVNTTDGEPTDGEPTDGEDNS